VFALEDLPTRRQGYGIHNHCLIAVASQLDPATVPKLQKVRDMKTTVFLLAALYFPVQMQAQNGRIVFANNISTRVTNSLTGAAAAAGNSFRVDLYAAPDGTTNDSQFALVTFTNFFAPGLFNGGERTLPLPGNSYAMLQVRVWETTYGSSYEEAVAAPPINGRTALTGKSVILRAYLNAIPQPPYTLVQLGLNPIVLTSQPVPSFFIDNIVVSEGTNGTKQAVFTVTMNPPATNSATVDFSTVDGTALAGSDYITTNGTLTFAAGQTTNTVSVTLTPDMAAESDEEFFVQLSNGVGALIGQAMGRALITEVRVNGISVDVAVTFNTVFGHHYVVEKSDDFVNWSAVTGAENVTGTGGATSIYDRGAGCQAQRLYRARLLD